MAFCPDGSVSIDGRGVLWISASNATDITFKLSDTAFRNMTTSSNQASDARRRKRTVHMGMSRSRIVMISLSYNCANASVEQTMRWHCKVALWRQLNLFHGRLDVVT